MWRCRWRCRWRRTRAWPQRWRQWAAPDLHGRQRGRLGQAVDKLLHRCAPVRGRGILEGLPGALLGRAHVAAEVEVALRGGRLLGVEGLEVLLSHVLLSHVQLLLLVRQRGSDGEDVITRARVASRQVAAAERGRREECMRPKAQGQGERHLCGRFRAKRLIGLRRSSGSSSSSAFSSDPRHRGRLGGWGPLGEAFRLFESDGRKMVLGRAAGGAEVDRPLGTCSGWAIPGNGMNERVLLRSQEGEKRTLAVINARIVSLARINSRFISKSARAELALAHRRTFPRRPSTARS